MLHDLYQVWAKPTRPKGGPYPTSNGGHACEEEQASVETQRRCFEGHHHTTENKKDGVEAKERAALRIHFSRIGHSINKQEMNREGSYSLDLKR